jgi:TIR domain
MTGGIFISYRRSDSKSDARSICQRLEKTFGKRRLFIDVDSIKLGENFQSVLKNDLEKCDIMVAVIGPRWLELLRSSGPAEGETRHDYVHLEVASALERKLPIFPVLVDGATMPEAKELPDDLKPLAFRQAFSVRHDSFPRDMWGLEQELRRALPKRWIWKLTVAVSGLFIISSGAISYYFWRSPVALETAYAKVGNFACFSDAEFPGSWREEAPLCAPYGCNFGKMSRDACLALGARKQSKTVIHGNAGTSRANECWLQHSCGNLQPHYEFTMFKM